VGIFDAYSAILPYFVQQMANMRAPHVVGWYQQTRVKQQSNNTQTNNHGSCSAWQQVTGERR
jgi:hypothetical protein